MKISMICFSLTGQETAEKLMKGFSTETVSLYKKSKYLPDSIRQSTGEWAGEQFEEADAIIFIGACGIAVRSIAAHIVSKKTDPAVLVVDECGKFVISLLSGHLGGANNLALRAAEFLGATAVVTTATDLHKRFAVDVFAKKNDCAIFNMKAAKEVSAAILAGEKVGFYSEFPWEGELPEGLVLCKYVADAEKSDATVKPDATKYPKVGIAVTIHTDCQPFASTTAIVPKAVTLGMGCRKGKEADAIRMFAQSCLGDNAIYQEAVCQIASIDIKKEEAGLQALSADWRIPFVTFSDKELLAVPGEFTPSSFVQKTVGVENVCERSAVLASGQGHLIQKKRAADGMTSAFAIKDWRIRFE